MGISGGIGWESTFESEDAPSRSIVEAQWASALRGAGQARDAIAHNQTSLALAQALSHDAPASLQYRIDVGVGERKLSDSLLAAGDPNGALRHA